MTRCLVMKKKIIICLFCSCVAILGLAQIPDSVSIQPERNSLLDSLLSQISQDSLQIDSILTKKKKRSIIAWLKSDYPDPKKSLILSIVPGLGQAYNKKYWKIPIVYAAIGGLIYTVDYNSRQYNRLQTAYLAKVDDDENTVNEFVGTALDNATTLKNLRNGFDKNRQLSWIGLVLVYALNGVDAFVDGHLLNFDIDEDLSMKVTPQLEMNAMSAQTLIGMGVVFQLK